MRFREHPQFLAFIRYHTKHKDPRLYLLMQYLDYNYDTSEAWDEIARIKVET